MITTTLNKIKTFNPCTTGWNMLLTSLNKTEADDDAIPLSHILTSNGFDDVCWVIEILGEEDLRKIRSYLCDIAEIVLENIHPLSQPLPKQLIELSRKRISGECSGDEVRALSKELKDEFQRNRQRVGDRQYQNALTIIRAARASCGGANIVSMVSSILVNCNGVSYNEQSELFLKAIN